jgi:hypothetical protein
MHYACKVVFQVRTGRLMHDQIKLLSNYVHEESCTANANHMFRIWLVLFDIKHTN